MNNRGGSVLNILENSKEQEELFRKVLEKKGLTHQTMILGEELSELNQAASKAVRYGATETREHLSEEIGDVIVMLKQFMYYYNVTEKEIEDIVAWKIGRLGRKVLGVADKRTGSL